MHSKESGKEGLAKREKKESCEEVREYLMRVVEGAAPEGRRRRGR